MHQKTLVKLFGNSIMRIIPKTICKHTIAKKKCKNKRIIQIQKQVLVGIQTQLEKSKKSFKRKCALDWTI